MLKISSNGLLLLINCAMFISSDAGSTKNSGCSKDNVVDPVSEKAAGQSSSSQDTKNKERNFAVRWLKNILCHR